MKRCPTCKRTYDDDTLSFCLEDGTPLTREPAASDPDATLVSPSPRPQSDEDKSGELLRTQAYNQLPGRPTVSASQTPVAPPPQYPIHSAPPTQRKAWPWILAIVAVLFVGIIVVVAIAVVIPQLTNPSPNHNLPVSSPTPISSPTTENGPTPETSVEENDAPTDHDEVLADLKDLEDEWERANVEADKEALDRILADEYEGDNNSTKQRYLDTLTAHPGRRWRYSNFALDLEGKRATLTYRLDRISGEDVESYSYVDTFVWRDERWQATSSRQVR